MLLSTTDLFALRTTEGYNARYLNHQFQQVNLPACEQCNVNQKCVVTQPQPKTYPKPKLGPYPQPTLDLPGVFLSPYLDLG